MLETPKANQTTTYSLNWLKRECGESEKNWLDSARLNPKHYNNGQSAAKPEKERSTTIPYGSTLKWAEMGDSFIGSDIVCTIWKHIEVHKRTGTV